MHHLALNRRQLLALSTVAISLPAFSQAGYPSKPITVLVPFAAGGTTDILGRLVARHLATRLGGTVIVDNKPGAGGGVGAGMVAKAAGDGHTLLMGTIGTHAINQYLYKKMAYDPSKDFAPISLVAMVPNVLVVHPSLPVKSVKELIAYAKANPDKVTYGSAGNGTSIHLAGDLFEKAAGIKLSHIPYKGSNPALMDALAGNVDLLVSSLPSAMGQIKAGKLRPLAVTSAKRSSSLPDVPTVAESGFKDFDVSTWYGVFAPAGTPAAVVTTVNAEINKLLATADMKAAIQAQGAEPEAMSPAQLGNLLKKEYTQWKGIVEASGAKIE